MLSVVTTFRKVGLAGPGWPSSPPAGKWFLPKSVHSVALRVFIGVGPHLWAAK